MKVSFDAALAMHVDLIQFFRDGHCTTVRDICERYGVSERTAQRYLLRVERYVPLERRGANVRKLRF